MKAMGEIWNGIIMVLTHQCNQVMKKFVLVEIQQKFVPHFLAVKSRNKLQILLFNQRQ